MKKKKSSGSFKNVIYKIRLMVRVFPNDPEAPVESSQKMIHNASLLNTQRYKVWTKGKWSNQEKGVVTSPTPQCSSN